MLLHSSSSYQDRYSTHIQKFPDLFQWSTVKQKPCLTPCNQPSWASLIRLCPTKELCSSAFRTSSALAVSTRAQNHEDCSCQGRSTAAEELSSKSSPDGKGKGLQSRVTGIYSSCISQHIQIHPLASLNFNWSTHE